MTKLEVLLPLKARPSPPDRRAFFYLEAIFGVSRSESMAFFAFVKSSSVVRIGHRSPQIASYCVFVALVMVG